MSLHLRQAGRMRGDAGQLLPCAYHSFQNAGIQMRRGHLHLMAAAPGVGKSVLAMDMALKMHVPTQYFSMDTDAHTTCVRVVQSVAIVDGRVAEESVRTSGLISRQALDAIDWLRFDFPSGPDTEEIAHRVWAYAETEGSWPHLIVIDNLMDVEFEGGEENRGLNSVMDDMAKLARFTQAAVLVLHHTTGEYEDGDREVRLSGLRQKVGKKPAMVLTLSNGGFQTQLIVNVVKNRFGPKVRVALNVDYARMQVSEEG